MVQDVVKRVVNLVIPESKHLEAQPLKRCISAGVALPVYRLRMLAPIKLNNDFCLEGSEVNDIPFNGYLPLKLEVQPTPP